MGGRRKLKYIIICIACMLVLYGLGTVLQPPAAAAEQEYLVKLRPAKLLSAEKGGENARYVVLTEEELARYMQWDLVESYEPDYEVSLHGECWNLNAIGRDFLWENGCHGDGVRVAVIDSGLAAEHDIAHIVPGHNYLDGSDDVTDRLGHGTFVSGLIASEEYGAAACAEIVPLKCFDKGVTTHVSDLKDAITKAVDEYHCRVINMSFGLTVNSLFLKEAIDHAAEQGAILVASVGNDGDETLYYPAAYENVIGVGSVGPDGEVSSFSQRNKSVYITAPGAALESLRIPDYTDTQGTSFSVPHIAALAAAACSVRENLTAEEFRQLLAETSRDAGAEGYDSEYGWGVADGRALLMKMLEGRAWFLSPVHREKDGALSVTVLRREEASAEECLLLCAGYSAEALLSRLQAEACAPPGAAAVTLSFTGEEKTCFYLLDPVSGSPLAQHRIIQIHREES